MTHSRLLHRRRAEKTRIGNICEANFFVGMHQIAKGNPAACR